MKDLIIILGILVLIFGGSYLASKYFEKSGAEIIEILDKMVAGFEKDTLDEKEGKINDLKEKWDEKQRIWITLQYHESINSMEDVVIECCNYYSTGNKEQFDISYEKLKRSIEDLKNREQISILNIM